MFDILKGLGNVADAAKSIVQGFFPPQMSESEKAAAQLKLQEFLAARDASLMDAQKSIMVAELAQSDAYTKRARPTVVYSGLLFIFFVHVILPAIAFFTGKAVPDFHLPEEFWWSWTSLVGVWAIGRTMEKTKAGGLAGQIASAITGGR